VITSDGWFVLNLTDALAVRNERKGGAVYPLESQESPFGDFGVNVRVVWPGQPNALYHAESGQEGFLVLAGECTLIVEEEERPLRQWDYFHCPPDTRHVIVGAGDGPCAILMIGLRPEVETLHYPGATSRRSTARPSPRRPTNRTRHTPTGRASICRCAFRGRSRPTRSRDGP
jgi:uncharacterized cupin superfamily protein